MSLDICDALVLVLQKQLKKVLILPCNKVQQGFWEVQPR